MVKDDDLRQKIAAIEEEIRTTPYHKGTEHHLGRLKARLAKLRRTLEYPAKKGKGTGFAPKKEGDATVVLVGPPSVGKSTLLNQLTAAASRVAPWDFTTLTVIPGMMKYRGAYFQILDLPGLVEGAAEGRGKGKEALSVARMADLILVLVDARQRGSAGTIMVELKGAGVDLGKTPFLLVFNKADLLKKRPPEPRGVQAKQLFVSAQEGTGVERLKEAIWQNLGLIRVFLAPKGKPVEREHPLILKKGATVSDAEKLIFGQEESGKKPFVTGPSVPYPNHQVGRHHQLFDQDSLRFV